MKTKYKFRIGIILMDIIVLAGAIISWNKGINSIIIVDIIGLFIATIFIFFNNDWRLEKQTTLKV